MSTPDAPHTPAAPPVPTAPSWPAAGHAEAAPYAPLDDVRGPGHDAAPTPARRSGLALTAFVVGLVSVLLCLIPLVNVASVVGGLVAVVLGVVALRRLAPGVTGKGFAITGLVLGAVSVIVAAVMLVAIGMAAKSLQESGELDALLEEVEAAQGAEVAEPEAAPADAAAAPAQADDPAQAEVAADPQAGADVVRADFADLTCDVVNEEAVLMAQESPEEGAPVLVGIVESVPVEDHRTDYAVPAGTDESLVLSCQGIAAWDDSTQSSILTEVTVDGAGNVYVGATAE